MKLNDIVVTAAALAMLRIVPLRAQETNPPPTILETFEAQVGAVIIKGSGQIGSVSAQAGIVSVKCKESKDARTGKKESGIAIGLKAGDVAEDTTIIDYDELDSFLYGIDYISRVDYTVTPLPSFDAVYTTKGGFRITAHSSNKRPGTIQASLQSAHTPGARVLLAPDQLAQFQVLVQQAKAKLDSLRANK